MKAVCITTATDYRKLLKRCIDVWYECEGTYWSFDTDNTLTDEEKKAMEKITEELGLVG